jgi:hypothetical protein
MVVMPMWSGSGRHVVDVAMAHARLGNYVVRESLHLGAPAFEHGHLKAPIMVEMDMQGCLRKAMMRLEILGQAFGGSRAAWRDI